MLQKTSDGPFNNEACWLDSFMLPDPRLLNAQELREIFLKVTNEFSERLPHCSDPSEILALQQLHDYLKNITTQIELRDKSILKSL